MSFQTGLSGLSASGKALDVIGHNIANANTVGMKASRTEFSDVVASSLGASGGGGAGGSGIGVRVAAVTQQFSQGNITITGNNLDLAINGGGFFQVKKVDGTIAYSRDGQFKLDANGYIVNNAGSNLLGIQSYPTASGNIASPVPLSLPTAANIPAKQTTNISAEFNLDARAPEAATQVPPTPVTTYGTSVTAYDAQGKPVPVSMYFERVSSSSPPVGLAAGKDYWKVYYTDPANATPTAMGYMAFDSAGKLTNTYDATGAATASNKIFTQTITPASTTVTPAFPVTIDVSTSTQFGASFGITALSQDGYTTGQLTGISVSDTGAITSRYSNGQNQVAGTLVLADFRNVQGLQPDGGDWVATTDSGAPVPNLPRSGNLGAIRSGALEDSNVDLTSELVNMMTAQRNYQANAQTIKTQDQVMSTLVNMR